MKNGALTHDGGGNVDGSLQSIGLVLVDEEIDAVHSKSGQLADVGDHLTLFHVAGARFGADVHRDQLHAVRTHQRRRSERLLRARRLALREDDEHLRHANTVRSHRMRCVALRCGVVRHAAKTTQYTARCRNVKHRIRS